MVTLHRDAQWTEKKRSSAQGCLPFQEHGSGAGQRGKIGGRIGAAITCAEMAFPSSDDKSMYGSSPVRVFASVPPDDLVQDIGFRACIIGEERAWDRTRLPQLSYHLPESVQLVSQLSGKAWLRHRVSKSAGIGIALGIWEVTLFPDDHGIAQ